VRLYGDGYYGKRTWMISSVSVIHRGDQSITAISFKDAMRRITAGEADHLK
jgi:hypothetical protein